MKPVISSRNLYTRHKVNPPYRHIGLVTFILFSRQQIVFSTTRNNIVWAKLVRLFPDRLQLFLIRIAIESELYSHIIINCFLYNGKIVLQQFPVCKLRLLNLTYMSRRSLVKYRSHIVLNLPDKLLRRLGIQCPCCHNTLNN